MLVKSNFLEGEKAYHQGNFSRAISCLIRAIETADYQVTKDTERAERLLQTSVRKLSSTQPRNKPPRQVLEARDVLKRFRESVKDQKRRH